MAAAQRTYWIAVACLTPLIVIISYFFLYPLVAMFFSGLRVSRESSAYTWDNYLLVFLNERYRRSLLTSIVLSTVVTLASLIPSTLIAFFLGRNVKKAKKLLVALITFPLAFPGVLVGFMIIILFGHTGVIPQIFRTYLGISGLNVAYTLVGLFIAYLYFEIPRVTISLLAAVENLNPIIEEAARSLGANGWQRLRYVTLPALSPALLAAAILAFATSMGAFGTAFTIAQGFNVLPMLIYTEYTLAFKFQVASALSVILGVITFVLIFGYRRLSRRLFAEGARRAQ